MELYFFRKADGSVRMATGDNIPEEGEVLLVPNSTDASREKHVPFVSERDGKVVVQVGEVLHPSTKEHYISAIVLLTTEKAILKRLLPEEKPVREFALAKGERPLKAYSFCNLHGLFEKDL
jgi:superoxide reductase